MTTSSASRIARRATLGAWHLLTHAIGLVSGRFYFEDFVRVYPDGLVFNRLGVRKQATQFQLNNYVNHRKFYQFAAQFARGRVVADIGCGSGYGCAILKAAGASRVAGADLSRHAIGFARRHYASDAEFSVQGTTDLRLYPDSTFDLVVSSEVLEHVKEYDKEDAAVRELKRIARSSAVVVIGTPNSEVLGDHGFSFEEIDSLMTRHFTRYCIFENALIPSSEAERLWSARLASGRTGVVVSESIDLAETALVPGDVPRVKSGSQAGTYALDNLTIDTTLLHNTHSWIAVARAH
jgi:SAM-dependent methyltransferase